MYASKAIAEELSSEYRIKLQLGQSLDVIEIRQRKISGPKAILKVLQGEVRYCFGGWPRAAYKHFKLAEKATLSDPDCVERIKENLGTYFVICNAIGVRSLMRYLMDIR